MTRAKDTDVTDVIFRVWRPTKDGDRGGDVIALFPYERATLHDHSIMSYMHVGQHGGADYQGCIARTRPARPDEYAALQRELEQIGYKLRVCRRRQWRRP